MPPSSIVKSAGDTPFVLEPFIGPETPSHLEGGPEKQLEQEESQGEAYPSRDVVGVDRPQDTTAGNIETEAPQSRTETQSEPTTITQLENEAPQTHTERQPEPTTITHIENQAPQARTERQPETSAITNNETKASQPRATRTMASSHTEPAHQHTKWELMHPGREQHLNSQQVSQPCPDPSVHRDTRLQEQASSAALYVTKPNNKVDQPREEVQGVLDANNKLSSRSAATSLKYARPEDLPSYPVVGINTASSANAAANLANTNHKQFEHWKPDASSNASKAAMLAKDYKMAPLWKPEMSSAGSKAALLAHRDGPKLDLWTPTASAAGNSAASLAMQRKSTSPQLDYGYTEDGRKRALVAATGALSKSQSKSATPPPARHPAYPDSKNSAYNALNAATVANRPAVKKSDPDSNNINSDAMRAARVQNYGQNVDRQMFTERPPVAIEKDEKQHQAALRASAISMAKNMYNISEKKRREGEAAELAAVMPSSAANAVHGRSASTASAPPDVRQQALQYIHLQEAAQKLAQERLAKMDPDGAARYREHYGYVQEAPRNRLSLRGRPRRRADSETTAPTQLNDDSSDDEFTARRIRNQQSGLNNSVAQVDAKKRATDRAALLAAAERKVQAQMHNMDEKVFQETGKVTPAMMEGWEAKARARATADSEVRQKNFGKVNIGGGKYMDQSELEAIAQSRLQPTLNQISDTAQKKRALDEERRLDEEEKKRVTMSEKEKEKEVKAEQKRLKAEEKAAQKSEKAQAKASEKARKAEEKQAKRDSKLRTKETKKEAAEGAAVSANAHDNKSAEVDTTRTSTATEPIVATSSTVDSADANEITRTGTNETTGTAFSDAHGNLRPGVERHVSTVVTSSSSGSSISSLSDSDIEEEPEEVSPIVATTGTTVPTTTTGAVSGDHEAARIVAERVTSPPVEAESAAAKTVVTSLPEAQAEEAALSSPKKSRGFGGFFGKFKRRSQAQAEPGTFGSSGVSSTKGATTLGGATPAVAGDAAADVSDSNSTSSFRRHETDLRSISSLSSSDGESGRGRSGKRSTGIAGKGKGVESDDDDEFEEARDRFDESAGPASKFEAERKKSTDSPITETKFHEEF